MDSALFFVILPEEQNQSSHDAIIVITNHSSIGSMEQRPPISDIRTRHFS
jgi:hypothetical protein